MNELKQKMPLHAVWLRLLALGLMLLDHLWATVIPGNMWMTYLGRLAFPIFAFQIAEGYYHTSDVKKYVRRLLLFGVISEIPFNLMMSGSWIYPFHQNVMFTLALGLMAIRAMEKARQTRDFNKQLLAVFQMMAWVMLGAITFVDYGGYGVMTVLLFGFCRHLPWSWLFQLAGMVAINGYLMKGMTIPLLGMDFPIQGFAVFSLLLIWLYNGEKGPRNRWFQYGSYAFYPLHMLILYGVGRFL